MNDASVLPFDAVALLAALRSTPAQWFALTVADQFARLATLGGSDATRCFRWKAIYDRFGGGYGVDGQTLWCRVGDYAHEAPSVLDPVQGNGRNCWLMASLASVAWTAPIVIAAGSCRGGVLRSDGNAVSLTLYDPTTRADRVVTVTGRVPVLSPSASCADDLIVLNSRGRTPSQSWCQWYEKAFATWITGATDERPRMGHNGYFTPPHDAHAATVIAGGNGTAMIGGAKSVRVPNARLVAAWNDPATLWRFITDRCDANGRATTALIASSIAEPPPREPPVEPHHFFSLLGHAVVDGERVVVLRNTFGRMDTGGQGEWMGLRLGEHGVGMLPFDVFRASFDSISGNWFGTPKPFDFATGVPWW